MSYTPYGIALPGSLLGMSCVFVSTGVFWAILPSPPLLLYYGCNKKVSLCSNAADYAEMRKVPQNTVFYRFRQDRRFIGQTQYWCNAQYVHQNLRFLSEIVRISASLSGMIYFLCGSLLGGIYLPSFSTTSSGKSNSCALRARYGGTVIRRRWPLLSWNFQTLPSMFSGTSTQNQPSSCSLKS